MRALNSNTGEGQEQQFQPEWPGEKYCSKEVWDGMVAGLLARLSEGLGADLRGYMDESHLKQRGLSGQDDVVSWRLVWRHSRHRADLATATAAVACAV